MACTATGVMRPINNRNQILTTSAATYGFRIVNRTTGEVVLNPTDFKLRFFIRNVIDGEIVCSREGSNPPVNCQIEEDGKIICFLPKDTFREGRLCIETEISTPWAGFPPNGKLERQRVWDTGCIYINGRGL